MRPLSLTYDGFELIYRNRNFLVASYAAAAVGRAEVESAVLKPQDVHITMGRNEITILKYVYNTAEDGFNIFLRVNDRWEQIHSMVVD